MSSNVSTPSMREQVDVVDESVKTAANSYEAAAAVLVQQYLGSAQFNPALEALDKRPFRRTAPRGLGQYETLARYLVQQEAAKKIQKSFRRYQSEQSLRRRSFGKFGREALELIRRYTQAAGKLQEETFASKARLILHFDINKTIIMSDKAKDEGVDSIVNSLLSDCAWGRLEPGPIWVPVGRLATDRPANDLQLMTYRSYLDSFLYPYEEGKGANVQKRNTDLKQKRQILRRRFTEPDQPGAMFRGVFEQLRKALFLPEGKRRPNPLFEKGDIQILPSFFNLLIHLQNQKREFAIIFRTFGEDIPQVIEEMNLFCTGKHPQYPNVRMDGSDGRTDLRLSHSDSLGIYHRSSTKPDGSVLLIGSRERIYPLTKQGSTRASLEKAAVEGAGMLLSSFQDIHSHYVRITNMQNRAFAVCDYYPFWKSQNERSRAGKPFFLDPSDQLTLKIFFDDNIGYTTAHIVDARDVRTGMPLPFKDVVGKNLLKVEPLNAILDPHYFVRAVHECVVTWLKSHSEPFGRHPDLSGRLRVQGEDDPRVSIANTSRRARDLWSILQSRVLAFIRLKHALQDSS